VWLSEEQISFKPFLQIGQLNCSEMCPCGEDEDVCENVMTTPGIDDEEEEEDPSL